MNIIIFDINSDIIYTCENILKDTNIQCVCKSFNEIDADYVVTAGNSLGVMSGGIDLAVRQKLGIQIQDRLQAKIMYHWQGFLPVGNLIEISFSKTDNKHKLLYVPTMDVPKLINFEDIYYVACKIFRHCKNDLMRGKSLAICGLGTCTGGVSAKDFAFMIKRAYEDILCNT